MAVNVKEYEDMVNEFTKKLKDMGVSGIIIASFDDKISSSQWGDGTVIPNTIREVLMAPQHNAKPFLHAGIRQWVTLSGAEEIKPSEIPNQLLQQPPQPQLRVVQNKPEETEVVVEQTDDEIAEDLK